MKRIVVLASALIFTASMTVFGQTQKPAANKDPQKPATTTTTSTVKQEQAKPATATSTHTTATAAEKNIATINASELPKAAQDYITRTYPGKKIEKAEKVTDSKGTVTYKAELAGIMMHFDSAGKFLGDAKKEMKPATETKPAAANTQPATSTEKKK
jgi:hypothetical protein